jgi:hypothetical protein
MMTWEFHSVSGPQFLLLYKEEVGFDDPIPRAGLTKGFRLEGTAVPPPALGGHNG